MIYSRPTALTADRSLPRKSIVMIIHPDEMARVPEPALPDGYAFRTYLPGDEKNWARITTIVDEFSCEQNAENAFRKQFMQDEDALRKRLSFVIAPDGNAIATSMAWNFDENDRHFGRVHWICTDPAHQGKGSLPAGRMCSSRVFRCHRAYAPSEWVALVCGKTSYASTPVSAVYIPPASSRRSPPRTRSSR